MIYYGDVTSERLLSNDGADLHGQLSTSRIWGGTRVSKRVSPSEEDTLDTVVTVVSEKSDINWECKLGQHAPTNGISEGNFTGCSKLCIAGYFGNTTHETLPTCTAVPECLLEITARKDRRSQSLAILAITWKPGRARCRASSARSARWRRRNQDVNAPWGLNTRTSPARAAATTAPRRASTAKIHDQQLHTDTRPRLRNLWQSDLRERYQAHWKLRWR